MREIADVREPERFCGTAAWDVSCRPPERQSHNKSGLVASKSVIHEQSVAVSVDSADSAAALFPKKTGPEGPGTRNSQGSAASFSSARRRCVARAFTVPGDVGRMLVRLLVDVRDRDDAEYGKHDDAGGNTPSAIRLGGNVTIDVIRHGRNVIETRFAATG